MHRVSTRLLVLLLTCLLFFPFTGNARDTSSVFGSKVFFFQTDSVQLKRDFKTNRRVFDAPDFLLNMPEIYNHIDSVLVVGAASPIGSGEHNYALSIARAKAMEVYIMWKHPDFDCGRITEKAAGIDREGFRYLVAHDARVPDKGKILVLLNNTRNEELLLRELRSLSSATQKYLRANIFSRLQYVRVRFRMDDGSYIPLPEGSPPGDFFENKDGKDIKEAVECDTVFIRDTIVQTLPIVFPEKNRTHPVFTARSALTTSVCFQKGRALGFTQQFQPVAGNHGRLFQAAVPPVEPEFQSGNRLPGRRIQRVQSQFLRRLLPQTEHETAEVFRPCTGCGIPCLSDKQ